MVHDVMKTIFALAALLLAGQANAQSFPGFMPAKTVVCNSGTAEAYGQNCLWFSLALTNKWFEDSSPPANITRLGDRVYIGDAINFKQVGAGYLGTDWFATFQCTLTPNGCGAYTHYSHLIVEGGGDTQHGNSSSGILTANQSKNAVNNGEAILPLQSFAVLNSASHNTLGWGLYGECHVLSGAASGSNCYGMELDVRTVPNTAGNPDPFQQSGVVGIQNACGAGITSPSANNCGAAMQILTNPNAWNAGIVIFSGAISAGSSGTINAIAMPTTYQIVWFSGAGTSVGKVYVGGGGRLNLDGNSGLATNGNNGITCASGINTSTFRSVNGLVTAC